ncbi:hypothetical protein [Novispirillum itersonii]|uniref:Uncharacterized protein n=1 Tax=Novispirillum itersonii TaxID=189 RepID=A0A7W9ZIL2_NOVIT|nr:hypothetical protein [Novispirillum itersonii]MBB6211708.1 hypothetical protein [Novispirillum itersonii]
MVEITLAAMALAAAQTMATAGLEEVTKDLYGGLKRTLKDRFRIGAAVEALEEAPQDADTQDFVAKKLETSGALSDAEVLQALDALKAALLALPERATPQTAILIEAIRAHTFTFTNVHATGGASIVVKGVEVTGALHMENVTARG